MLVLSLPQIVARRHRGARVQMCHQSGDRVLCRQSLDPALQECGSGSPGGRRRRASPPDPGPVGTALRAVWAFRGGQAPERRRGPAEGGEPLRGTPGGDADGMVKSGSRTTSGKERARLRAARSVESESSFRRKVATEVQFSHEWGGGLPLVEAARERFPERSCDGAAPFRETSA